MRDSPNLTESAGSNDPLLIDKDKLLAAVPDLKAKRDDLEAQVAAADARVDNIAATLPDRLVKYQDPVLVCANSDDPLWNLLAPAGLLLERGQYNGVIRVPLAALRDLNRRYIVRARCMGDYAKGREEARQRRRWWIDTMRARRQVLDESGYTDAISERDALYAACVGIEEQLDIAESFTTDSVDFRHVDLPGDAALAALVNRSRDLDRLIYNSCGGPGSIHEAASSAGREVNQRIASTWAHTLPGALWKLRDLLEGLEGRDDLACGVDLLRSAIADLQRLVPIDPTAPFDAAAWVRGAEARGYRFTVMIDEDSDERSLHRKMPDHHAADDHALFEWISQDRNARRDEYEREVADYVTATGHVIVYSKSALRAEARQ